MAKSVEMPQHLPDAVLLLGPRLFFDSPLVSEKQIITKCHQNNVKIKNEFVSTLLNNT